MTEESYICTSCGNLVKPKTNTKGSFWMEVLLWLLFILPGVLYSFWRLGNKVYACPACGKETVIPLNTPVGQKLYKDYGKTLKDSETGINDAQKEKSTPLTNKIIYGVITLVLLYILLIMLS